MKTALVTGSFGFVGRHMVEELRHRGYSVGGWELPSWDLLEKVQHVTTKFDLVVHCAYHVGGRAGIDGRNLNFMKNLQLDAALFEWAVRTEQKRVLYFSSSAVYPVYYQEKEQYDMLRAWVDLQATMPEHERDHYIMDDLRAEMRLREDAHIETTWADANYGFAKVVGERLAEDARKNGLAVTVVRPFSGYGEDQSTDYPFPSIVARAKQGDLTVWGPPGQTRDWIHISDVVNGALAVADAGTTDPVNLCTGRATEMGELMKMVWRQVADCGEDCMHDLEADTVTYDESKPTGVFYRVGDPTRMLQYYSPKVSLEEGIRRALI